MALSLRGTTWRDWSVAVGLGAVIGTVILGVAGRVAMRAIAVAQRGVPEGFTMGGTMTVVLLGTASGALGGILLVISRWLFPSRRWAQVSLYWAALLLLALRGLHPLDALRVALFVPLVLLYGAVLQAVWDRGRAARHGGLT